MAVLDKFHWAKRVSRGDIRRLYESDARGLLDEELLEELHFAIYARVLDMFEVRAAQTFGRVKCRACGALLGQPYRMGAGSKEIPLHCAQCGWQTTCGEFYASYTGKSLLPGSVVEIFEAYLERFPAAHTTAEKMLLIDWLIHQFHIHQGVARMPVGENVIQGTGEQVRALIEGLASGAGSTPGLSPREDWQALFYDPVRLFKQAHSHSEVQRIAAELGIEGRRQMAEEALIPEIFRRAPQLAEAFRRQTCTRE